MSSRQEVGSSEREREYILWFGDTDSEGIKLNF